MADNDLISLIRARAAADDNPIRKIGIQQLREIPTGPDDPRWVVRTKVLDGDMSKLNEIEESPVVGNIAQLNGNAAPNIDEIAAKVVAMQKGPQPPVGAAKRVVVSYGPKEGDFIVAVEVAPDWDSEGDPLVMDRDKVVAVIAVVKLLAIKVKNLTAVGFAT